MMIANPRAIIRHRRVIFVRPRFQSSTSRSTHQAPRIERAACLHPSPNEPGATGYMAQERTQRASIPLRNEPGAPSQSPPQANLARPVGRKNETNPALPIIHPCKELRRHPNRGLTPTVIDNGRWFRAATPPAASFTLPPRLMSPQPRASDRCIAVRSLQSRLTLARAFAKVPPLAVHVGQDRHSAPSRGDTAQTVPLGVQRPRKTWKGIPRSTSGSVWALSIPTFRLPPGFNSPCRARVLRAAPRAAFFDARRFRDRTASADLSREAARTATGRSVSRENQDQGDPRRHCSSATMPAGDSVNPDPRPRS
jgi:hypothetical protein